MKFSLWPNNNRTPAELLEQVRVAEDTGWHGVWLADHYMPNTGDTTPARGDAYECWALLPALAAVTERVRVGTLVSPTSVHHPALQLVLRKFGPEHHTPPARAGRDARSRRAAPRRRPAPGRR